MAGFLSGERDLGGVLAPDTLRPPTRSRSSKMLRLLRRSTTVEPMARAATSSKSNLRAMRQTSISFQCMFDSASPEMLSSARCNNETALQHGKPTGKKDPISHCMIKQNLCLANTIYIIPRKQAAESLIKTRCGAPSAEVQVLARSNITRVLKSSSQPSTPR